MGNREVKTYLETAFRHLNKKLDELFNMKDAKNNFLFVSWHQYSAKELFESSTYQSIQSMIEKIADDISNWQQSGTLGFGTRNIYNVNRDLLENRLVDFKIAVENREPTLWEQIASFFTSFINFVVEKLPKIWSGLVLFADKMQEIPFFGGVCKVVVDTDKSVRKLIVRKKYQYITDSSQGA